MALTLHPTLAAAQDSITGRKPIIKLLATQAQDSMPFDGALFNSSPVSEQKNALIASAAGNLTGVFVRNGVNLVQINTDTERTFWNETVSATNYGTIQNLGIVEIAAGQLGIVFTVGQALKYTVLDNSSNQLVAPATIQALVSPEIPLDPVVVKRTDGSYLLAYLVYDSSSVAWQIRTRTSADFITWSAASAVTLTGLLNTRGTANLAMIQVVGGEIMLLFDYVDLIKDDGLNTVSNVYRISSSNGGATWSTPEQITNYTEWGTSGINPSIAERTNGYLALAYSDNRKVLTANGDTDLWQTDCSYTEATNLHFDPATNRLYVYQISTYTGTKTMCGIVVIDTVTWEVVRTYTTQTSPDYHDIFKNEHVWYQKDRGDGQYAVFSTYGSGTTKALCVIDDSVQSITQYFFDSDEGYEITQNVEVDWPISDTFPSWDLQSEFQLKSTWTDASTQRVYVCFTDGNWYIKSVFIGYIDLTDPIDSATGRYSFHVICSSKGHFTEAQIMGIEQIIVVPESNFIIVMAESGITNNSDYPGITAIIDITSGEILKEFKLATHQSYPLSGVRRGCYYDGCLYGSFAYATVDDQENHRGMVKININSEEITYHEPTWKTANDYGLIQKVPTGDGRILVAVFDSPGGVASFDIPSGAWYLYSKESLQGFEASSYASSVYSVAYDAVNKQIMCGSINNQTPSYIGVRMFNEDGAYNIGKLIEGINSAGWVWGTPEDLTQGHSEIDMAVAVDAENIIWSTWTRQLLTESSAAWDRDVKDQSLVDYLVTGQPVTLNWSVDKTGTLSFTVSHGHLFDPNNLYSTWSQFLKKGKQIEISLGERIGGVDYWQTQGKYIIDALHISYARGQYPSMRVDCVSPDYIWGDIQVAATQRYDTSAPEEMVAALLAGIAGLASGAISIPNFPNTHEIHHQWVDADFRSIIEEILDHFQCVPYFDMDGIFAPKVLALDGAVAHAYVGSEIIKFTPDDNYSSFTNRITVNGEGLYFLEVTYEEELMQTITGTGGWWDDDAKTIRVNYSTDLDKVCYDPRLVVKTSIKDFKILWARSGGDEYLSYVDPNNRYCEIVVVFPGIMDVLIAAILLLIAVGTTAATCTVNCGPFIFALSLVSSGINYILGQVASYHYEVYAKPTGEEKQIVSSTVNDTDFQRLLGGLVVTETFDDPFCYTTQSCKQVADHEMAICQAQRSRVTFEKVGHLQDEICDIISIQHPYSQAVINLFITDLQRVYLRPEGPSEEGGLIDTIQGWRL